MLSSEHRKIIGGHPLFAGFDEASADKALELFCARNAAYKKGEYLHLPGSEFPEFGLVLSGFVHVCCDDFDGNRMIMAEVMPGVSFGESLCYLNIRDSEVYIYASEDAEVLWLSLSGLYGKRQAETEELERRFTALLALRTLSMNNRIQILSKLTIRDKLMCYFSELAAAAGSKSFTAPLSRDDMAAYIGANRSALSRELSAMKREGLIDFKKNRFTLL